MTSSALRAARLAVYGTADPALCLLPFNEPVPRNHRIEPEKAGDFMARTYYGWIIGNKTYVFEVVTAEKSAPTR